jgi:hypothetical protein
MSIRSSANGRPGDEIMQVRTARGITALSVAALAFAGLALNVCVASAAWGTSADAEHGLRRPAPYTFRLSSRPPSENVLPRQQVEQEIVVGWLQQWQ